MNKTAHCFLLSILLFTGCSCSSGPRQTPGCHHIESEHIGNFYRVSDGVYRSAQPDETGFKELHQMGFKSVLNLREYHSDNKKAAGSGLILYRYRLAAGGITKDQLTDCLAIIQNAPKPILIHCKHGADRTGAVCAAYRMAKEGWPANRAIDEMVNGPFGFHKTCYSNLPELLKNADTITN